MSPVDEQRELADQVKTWTSDGLHEQFRAAGVTRAYIVYKDGKFLLSHPDLLKPLQAFLEQSLDFAQHEGIFIGREDGVPMLFFAFVHSTRRGLAQGGLRLWKYKNLAEIIEDGLRLSQGMTRKNALAGLWWGGGKGIVPLSSQYKYPDEVERGSPERLAIFEAYGRFVASLGGVYYTAEDLGTKTYDMDAIFSQNRFVTCISKALGGSGNPSAHTATGVFRALQASWKFLKGTESLAGVRVAVQGAGNVARPLIKHLNDAGAEVWVSDIAPEALQAIEAELPGVHTVLLPKERSDEIFDLDVDIVAPCARGGVINEQTIPRIKAILVCGAANNILGRPEEDAERLHARGICFVPDYVCNRMGIVNCANEWAGHLEEDVRSSAELVYPDTLAVLEVAQEKQMTPLAAANHLADVKAAELHPLIGHRGMRIIDHLIESGWHR